MSTFFSDYFLIDPQTLDDYGAFNVSLVNDLPLFIDPFLLFNSENSEYVALHEQIIGYLKFLRDKANAQYVSVGGLKAWYCFPEIRQNWLGFSVNGNSGSGLGIDFARTLHGSLKAIFSSFGAEKITAGSHLEKICLIADGVGRDSISDFTTNLIQGYLCRYTEIFADQYLAQGQTREVWIDHAAFNFKTGTWKRHKFRLPWIDRDYVILTPKDMLTRDDTWISKSDLIEGFAELPAALPDAQLRAQVSDHFLSVLVVPEDPDQEPSQKARRDAALETIRKFPALIDYYIRMKEENGDEASSASSEKVAATEVVFIKQLRELQEILLRETAYYATGLDTYDEAHKRVAYLKDVIENKGGHRIFYHDGKPIEREKDLQVLGRLVWYGSPSDVGTEANDGRGPVDFKISRGAHDKTLIEMKLGSNTKLEGNLKKQVEIYKAASDARRALKVILFFSASQQTRVFGILKRLDLSANPDIVLIDARDDNEPSGSKA